MPKRLLYVTVLWSGLKDIVLDGAAEAMGMPAFINPLRKMIEEGYKIDFVVASPFRRNQLNIGAPWLRESNFVFVYWGHAGIQRILSPFRLYNAVSKIVALDKHDFIYCHGAAGAIGNLAARIHKIPCGQRLYGTFLYNESIRRPALIKFKHPLEYAAFILKKEFLIVTNDGTRGDKVQKVLAREVKRYKFFFLLNGVDKAGCTNKPLENDDKNIKVIYYPGRISRWKRQHLALETLQGLRASGYKDVELHFSGHIYDQSYWQEVQQMARDKGLATNIRYLGNLPKEKMYSLYKNAWAVLSFYEISNLSNIVLESLMNGAIVIALNDGSLDGIINDGQNGLLVATAQEAAEKIGQLQKNEKMAASIRTAAIKKARERLLSWDERASQEISIIRESLSSD